MKVDGDVGKFGTVEVQGTLIFAWDTDTKLSVANLFVRGGRLIMAKPVDASGEGKVTGESVTLHPLDAQ